MANVAAEVREHLRTLLMVFVDRYQLTEPYDSAGVEAIEAAIKAGAEADLAGLRVIVAEYNLYAHHEALAVAALDAAQAVIDDAAPVEPEPVEQEKPLSRQNKDELLATAAARGIEVPEGATVAQLRTALAPVGFTPMDTNEDDEKEEDEESTNAVEQGGESEGERQTDAGSIFE